MIKRLAETTELKDLVWKFDADPNKVTNDSMLDLLSDEARVIALK